MPDIDITVFAELLHSRFGRNAQAEAQRRAHQFELTGDSKNARAWRLIFLHVRRLQAGDLSSGPAPLQT